MFLLVEGKGLNLQKIHSDGLKVNQFTFKEVTAKQLNGLVLKTKIDNTLEIMMLPAESVWSLDIMPYTIVKNVEVEYLRSIRSFNPSFIYLKFLGNSSFENSLT